MHKLHLIFFAALSAGSLAFENSYIWYFGYGSNLLARRMHIMNPDAIFFSAAELKDYRLDFAMYSHQWRGAVATIVPTPGRSTWGALWLLPMDQISNLDKQEGVAEGWYFPKNVNVTTLNGLTLNARVYQEVNNPTEDLEGPLLPLSRRPSKSYLYTIIQGAIQSEVPEEYIRNQLQTIPHNGKHAVRIFAAKLHLNDTMVESF